MRICSPPNPLHSPTLLSWSRRLSHHVPHWNKCAAAAAAQDSSPGHVAYEAGFFDGIRLRTSSQGRRVSTLARAQRAGQGQQQQGSAGKDATTTGREPVFSWTRFLKIGSRRREAERVVLSLDDEGDWNVSPEWWGTQGAGWGHNAGDTVFLERSGMGNGVVGVTAHPASTPKPKDWAAAERKLRSDWQAAARSSFNDLAYRIIGYEWRVLRFNHVTRQSVAKVVLLSPPSDPERILLFQQPNCLAFECQGVRNGLQKMRILCIGLGGGSLPLFLAHNLPGATVEAVEIDGTVISAAIDAMGYPPCRRQNQNGVPSEDKLRAGSENDGDVEKLWGKLLDRLSVHEDDGVDYVCNLDESVTYNMVFIDAYDGQDRVPIGLWDVNGPFLESLKRRLHPRHGTVVVNLHSDSPPPPIHEKITGKFGAGFDPRLPQGKVVRDTCLAYRDVLVESTLPKSPTSAEGLAFTVSAAWQQNVALVVSRGALSCLQQEQDGRKSEVQERGGRDSVVLEKSLQAEARQVQQLLAAPFDFTKRVARGFQPVS